MPSPAYLGSPFTPAGAPAPFIQQLSDQVVSGNGTGVANFVTRGGDFLLLGLAAQSTGTFLSRLNATWEGNYLDNGQVRSANLWGTGQYPMWVRPKFIPANQLLSVELKDLTGSTNTIRLTLFGCIVPPSKKELWKARFGRGRGLMVYVTDTQDAGLVVGASSTLQSGFTCEDAFGFRLDYLNAVATSTNFLANVQYRDMRFPMVTQLSNARVHHDNLFGTNTLPFVFAAPPVLFPSSSFTYDMLDASGSQNTIRTAAIGERVPFDRSKPIDPADWDAPNA